MFDNPRHGQPPDTEKTTPLMRGDSIGQWPFCASLPLIPYVTEETISRGGARDRKEPSEKSNHPHYEEAK